MEEQIKEITSLIIKDFFQKIDLKFDGLAIEKIKEKENSEIYFIKINSTDNCSLFYQGENIKALEYLLRIIIIKKLGKKINLIVDLNNFREKRKEKISELARLIAKKVQTTQRAYILKPMPAYERRIIHLELANWSDVVTESIGQGLNRRVVIKPYP